MATKIVNNAAATTTKTGNGNVYTLAAGPTNRRQITAVFANNQEHSFYIENGVDFEHVKARYNTSGTTLTVLQIYSSSNGGAAVNWGAGVKTVVASPSADDLADMDNMNESALALILKPDERATIRKADPFYWKASKAVPVFGWGTGQSNIESAFPVAPGSGYVHKRNANVFEYGTDGSLTGPTAGVRAWRVADPTLPTKADSVFQSVDPGGTFDRTWVTTAGTFHAGQSNYHINGRGNGPYCGYTGGGVGLATLGAAQQIQEERGGRAYFGNIAWSGQRAEKWKPNVGECAIMWDAVLPEAIAALRALEPESFPGTETIPLDFLIISQGSSDVFATSPSVWADLWEEFLDHIGAFQMRDSNNAVNANNTLNLYWHNLKYLDKRNTLISIMQRTRRDWLHPSWNGQEILQQRRRNIRIMSSQGRQTADGLHFWGDVATEFGRDIARDWLSTGKGPVENSLDLVRHNDYRHSAIGRFSANGQTTLNTDDPGYGQFKFLSFGAGISISKVDKDGNPLDLTFLTDGDLITFQSVANQSTVFQMQVTGANPLTEYDTHWNFSTAPIELTANLTTGYEFDLYTTSKYHVPKIEGVYKLGTAQNVAANAVVDPGAGKFAINGNNIGLVISNTGSDGVAVSTVNLVEPGWIQFVKRDEPFKRFRLNITLANFTHWGDKGTWTHIQTSLNMQSAGFSMTPGAEYLMMSSKPNQGAGMAKLADNYRQFGVGFGDDAHPGALGAKAYDQTGLVMYGESKSKARNRLRFNLVLSEAARLATLWFSSSLRILTKGEKLSLSYAETTSGILRDAITITAKGGPVPVVAINGEIYGGIFAFNNSVAEAPVTTALATISVGWNINQPSNDIVPNHATGTLQVKTPGVYKIRGVLTFTGSALKTFYVGINGTLYQSKIYTGGDGSFRQLIVEGYKACALDENISLWVSSPDGTVFILTDGQLTARRVSS